MNIYSYIKKTVLERLKLNDDFSVETPKFEKMRDISLNIALVLFKKYNKSPKDLALNFIKTLKDLPFISTIEATENGFININLKHDFIYNALKHAIETDFGMDKSLGANQMINIEYCSANPTGPIHIGHTRGTVYGDVLSNLLEKNGYNVTREFYINDAGGQIETLVKSVLLRVKELQGESITIPEGCYPGEYLIAVAKRALEKFGQDVFTEVEKLKTFIVEEIMKQNKIDLKKLKVKHDVFTSEAEIIKSGEVEKSIDLLQEKGLIYKGTLPKPKGKLTEEWEEREQTIFKSTTFGDTEDRALKKSDGTNTYFTSDIAYHKNKIDRGFLKMIVVLGADHLGYVSRITAATKAIAKNAEDVDILVKICQIVKFLENGEPVKMSKRKGTFTTITDVLEEVNVDIIRFILLTKKNDSQMDFDLVKVKEESKENHLFYIQYGCARCSSLIRTYQGEVKDANLQLLKLKEEMDLIKKILEYPKVIESAVKKLEPHLIANYLYDLISKFHNFWNLGNEDQALKFITEDVEISKSRMFLVFSVRNIIFSAFSIFNIDPITKM